MINSTHYHKHSQKVFANYVVACAVALLFLDMFLEKIQLKDDSSNYADWVPKLRIVLIAAQKAYVLNAPLGVLHLEHRLWMLRTSDIHVFDNYMIVR